MKLFFRVIGVIAIIVGLIMFALGNDIGGIIAIIGAIFFGITIFGLIVAIVGFLIKIFFFDEKF